MCSGQMLLYVMNNYSVVCLGKAERNVRKIIIDHVGKHVSDGILAKRLMDLITGNAF